MTTAVSVDPAADVVRKRYNRAARFYDLEQAVGERLLFGRLRKQLWEWVPRQATVLEVGVGTGINMRHYPPDARVTAIDLSEKMLARARMRVERLGITAALDQMDAQHLAYEGASFDAVVATFVFCSVPDPVAGLREARRVLRPGGQLLLLEHVRSKNALAGKLMDWLNPAIVRLTGANINRRTVENVESAGFEDLRVSNHLLKIVKVIEARRPLA